MIGYEPDYRDLVQNVIDWGEKREVRNGMTRALFGQSLSITALSDGYFPLLTQRRIYYKGVLGELAAFVRGATTVGEFKEWGCNYWDANAKAWSVNRDVDLKDMEIGQVYGAQWINWEQRGFNQLKTLLKGLREDPTGRRHVITSFSPTAVACLPPCHLVAQFYVERERVLNCQVYMRSVDLILGLPSDVVLYGAMLAVLAAELNLHPGTLKFVFGDTHIYENHIETFRDKQLHEPLLVLPQYRLFRANLLDFRPTDIEVLNYNYAGVVPYDFNV